MSAPTIQSVSKENRLFQPSPEFAAQAHLSSKAEYERLYHQSLETPDAFWAEQAKTVHWFKAPTKILDWQAPHAKWFEDGLTNLAYNCVDRHLDGARANKAAIVWEGEPGDTRVLTYRQLARETARFANVLSRLGVHSGDRVAIYMGMVPEAIVAMLACARIGAIHSVIFGGFAAEAVRDRVNDAGAKVIVTQDGAFRRGNVVPLKPNVDRAIAECPSVKHVVVLKRAGNAVTSEPGRDHWWHDVIEGVDAKAACAELPAEHPLFILYTSGTTGKPKGVVHTTGGYLVGTSLTSKYVFDLKDEDVYWCTADIGWITGHSYVVYGPLANGATVFVYEGAPNQPDPGRFWSLIEKHHVSLLYTAPTAIRQFVRWGEQWPMKHDLSSLRLLGSVGEPINPEAWMWYRRIIGNDTCPIVDTWWQTETGAIMLSPLPGAIAAKPGSCTLPFFGVVPRIVDEKGNPAKPNEGGLLVLERPWPSMLRTIWNDDDRYRETYWSKFQGRYFTGDGSRCDEDGYFWVMGRVDDVVNVAGHRLGTAEIESALVAHPAVAEAAVVSRPDELKGSALVAFVTLKAGKVPSAELRSALLDQVANEIGKFPRPDAVRFADALPKTRSGKIMRRLLKDLAAGREAVGDTTTLEDIGVLASLREGEE